MDISVVITTHLVANKASLSYLAAKIAAVAPAGMPVIRTPIPSDVAQVQVQRPMLLPEE